MKKKQENCTQRTQTSEVNHLIQVEREDVSCQVHVMRTTEDSNWLPEHTSEELHKLQEEDENLSLILTWRK